MPGSSDTIEKIVALGWEVAFHRPWGSETRQLTGFMWSAMKDDAGEPTKYSQDEGFDTLDECMQDMRKTFNIE